MDCACNCHTKTTNGNPTGCEYCKENHVVSVSDVPVSSPPTPDQLKELAQRLVQEARVAMGPMGVVIIMVGNVYGNAHVAWGNANMLVLGLKEVCVRIIDNEMKGPGKV